jgi:hypothetical protein
MKSLAAVATATSVEQGPDHRREVLRQELDRVDALQLAYWPAAVNGDHIAANIVLKCIARRCTLLGLDRADNLNAATASVVVIGGTEEEYVNGLQAVIDQREREQRLTRGELGSG